MPEHRFNVFGTLLAVAATDHGWQTFVLGPDGKRRPAEFGVPSFVQEEELAQLLADFNADGLPIDARLVR